MSSKTGAAPEPSAAQADAPSHSRRESLKQIGKFAAATAPAMLVLLAGYNADACPEGKVPGKGHAYGRGSRV